MNWPVLLARRPWAAAVGLGTGLSLLSVPASMGVGLLAHALLSAAWFGKSAASTMGELSGWGFLLIGVFILPALETLLGQWAPMELLRRMRIAPPVCVMASAAVFGSLHWLAGGLGHGLTTFTSGSLFALAYALCRPAGVGLAITSAFAAHASHNLLVWFVLGPLLEA